MMSAGGLGDRDSEGCDLWFWVWWKGRTLGRMQTQKMGTTRKHLMPAAMLEAAARVTKTADLEIMCEVTPSGGVSLASLKFWGWLPFWHGWWSCWTEPALPLGRASGQRSPWWGWALRQGHSWLWLCLISLFCAPLFRMETLLLFGLLLYLPLPLHNKKKLLYNSHKETWNSH